MNDKAMLGCENDGEHCRRCSGEYCETHHLEPCDCDNAERHVDLSKPGEHGGLSSPDAWELSRADLVIYPFRQRTFRELREVRRGRQERIVRKEIREQDE